MIRESERDIISPVVKIGVWGCGVWAIAFAMTSIVVVPALAFVAARWAWGLVA